MMFMTARVDMKKILVIAGIIAVLLIAMIWLFGGTEPSEPTVAPSVSTNDGRVKFLKDLGWDVATSPVESTQVRIPENASEAFDRYNTLQKSQGYDLSNYAGKTAMRYVYKVNNYPGATEPVYATLLVYKNQIIGGDVTDTAANGKLQGFRIPDSSGQTAPSETGATAATQ